MTGRIRVLILEDRRLDVDFMVDALKRDGLAVDWVHVDGEAPFIEAITCAGDDGRFDIILADHSLPGYNALAALAELRIRGLDTPFIVVTGQLEDEAAVDCIKRGATDYLLKDRTHRLGPAVRRALEERAESVERERISRALEQERRRVGEALERSNAALEQRIAARTRDLSTANERLKAEIAQREQMQQALVESQRLKAVGTFSAGVAHHFNNILAVVIGNLEMALSRPLDALLHERLSAALHASRTGAKLTRQLLSFSRQQPIRPEKVNPGPGLAGIGALLSGLLRDDIRMDIDVSADLWPIQVDLAELELAIVNIVVNARDAMPGGGTIRLTARNRVAPAGPAGPDRREIVIEIGDDGMGMPGHVLANAFEPFFTTKKVGRGNGLGLSQVHGFADQSGGTAEIESRPDVGTTVRLCLPALDETVIDPPLYNAAEQRDEPVRTGRILVVDDERLVARMSQQMLAEQGHDALSVFRPSEALELLRGGERFDLLLTDVVMPEMSGLQLAEIARAQDPELLILLVTGHTSDFEEIAATRFPILSKPFSPKVLCRLVGELLSQRQAMR
jgi:signal transduction histidine kinase